MAKGKFVGFSVGNKRVRKGVWAVGLGGLVRFRCNRWVWGENKN